MIYIKAADEMERDVLEVGRESLTPPTARFSMGEAETATADETMAATVENFILTC